MRRAFSLVEVLVVISIIAVVAALSLPAFVGASERAHIESCASNLHQIYVAVALYRQEYESAEFGNLYQMGLPPDFDGRYLKLPKFHCSGLPNDLMPDPNEYPYFEAANALEVDHTNPTWAEYATKYGDEAILAYDMNHNLKDIPLTFGKGFVRFGLGVRLSGQLVRRRRSGNWHSREWWNDLATK